MYSVRNTTYEDLPTVEAIYAYAREQMRLHGNPTQWGSTSPRREWILDDIARGDSYVIVEDSEIIGVFALVFGEDPTYGVIRGAWISDRPYATIHRIAAAQQGGHIFDKCIAYCDTRTDNLRIDTHTDNRIMQHCIRSQGFAECGIITIADGTDRIAYQRDRGLANEK